MSGRHMDESFERDLSRFLDWQARQVAGAPTAEDVAGRIAGRLASTRTTVPVARIQFAPAAAITGLLGVALVLGMLAAAAFVAGQRDRSILPPDDRSVLECALEGVRATQATDSVPRTELRLNDVGADRVALASTIARDPRMTEIVVAGNDRPAMAVAVFELPDEPAYAVSLADWAPGGSAILAEVTAARDDPEGGVGHCRDLWLVPTDGSPPSLVARSDAALLVGPGTFGPGGEVAYITVQGVDSTDALLHVTEPSGRAARTMQACLGAPALPGVVVWSPSGDRVANVCGTRIEITDVATGRTKRLDQPGVDALGSTRWPVDTELLIVAERVATPGDQTVLAIDPRSGEADEILRLHEDEEHDWQLPVHPGAFSPDGRRLLASAWVTALGGVRLQTTHAIELASGSTVAIDSPGGVPDRVGWWGTDALAVVRGGSGELVKMSPDGESPVVLGSVPSVPLVWVAR